MNPETPKHFVTKAGYAAVGAPFVVGRWIRDLAVRLADHTHGQFEAFADEGAKLTKKLHKRDAVDEIEKESAPKSVAEKPATKATAKKPATKKPAATTAAKKPATRAKKGPAKKGPAAKPSTK